MSRASRRWPSALPYVAGSRLDHPEPDEHEAETASVPMGASELERPLEREPGRRKLVIGEIEVGTPDQHGGRPRSVAGMLEPGRALVEQRARSPELTAGAGDPGLTGEEVANRLLAGDLDERLQGVLKLDPEAGHAGRPVSADLGDVDR